MKLDKLWIKEFKNLKNISVDFDDKNLVTVIIGWNGAGKSNLLEALVIIFRDLDLGLPPSITYTLEYQCRDVVVKIDADLARAKKDQVKILINESPISFKQFSSSSNRQYLPSNIFGYYSGPSNRLEQHFESHQKRFYEALLKGDETQPLRPLFYARLIHSRFVLLAFFVNQDAEIKKFLKDYLFIEGLESILFEMKEPSWKSKAGDPRFWYARGAVQSFLDRLYEIAIAPLRVKRRVPTGLKKHATKEFLYLFVKDIDALENLATGYDSQRDFFKALESTYISELIGEVRIRVKVRKIDGSLIFREMSEGEQQLLTVLGLLRFTKEEESLFLLDEPDTHLNPAWSAQYLNLLQEVVGEQPSSHIIMATHDPLVLAELEKEQVQIMHRDEETMKVECNNPEESPIGLGYSGILMSDMFKFRSELDSKTLEDLDSQRKLAAKETPLDDEEQNLLTEVTERLEKKGFTTTFRDPYFAAFAKALAESEEYEPLQKQVLSKAEKEKEKSLAKKLLEELKSEEHS